MKKSHLKVTVAVTFLAIFALTESSAGVHVVSRDSWGARRPKSQHGMHTPVPYVVIHHSHVPGECHTRDDCTKAMRSIQNLHMDDRGWDDIGYNFAVGGDGSAYEARGWFKKGAHAPKHNSRSVGICAIGNFNDTLPPSRQLDGIRELISYGVSSGWIAEDYKLIGHRQSKRTECPGQTLYEEIITWEHYEPNPKRR